MRTHTHPPLHLPLPLQSDCACMGLKGYTEKFLFNSTSLASHPGNQSTPGCSAHTCEGYSSTKYSPANYFCYLFFLNNAKKTQLLAPLQLIFSKASLGENNSDRLAIDT